MKVVYVRTKCKGGDTDLSILWWFQQRSQRDLLLHCGVMAGIFITIGPDAISYISYFLPLLLTMKYLPGDFYLRDFSQSVCHLPARVIYFNKLRLRLKIQNKIFSVGSSITSIFLLENVVYACGLSALRGWPIHLHLMAAALFGICRDQHKAR